MSRKREDSFKIALETLRAELRTGVHAAGTRLTANEIAERLSLSQTPVREALSRLAGEGLLQDRRGQGFFVPSLSEHDLAVLFRLQHEMLRIACQGERSALSAQDIERLSSAGADVRDPQDLALASERLLRAFAAASSLPLARHLARLHDQLASVRAAEPRVLEGLDHELTDLAAAMVSGDARRVEAVFETYFERRIRAASALVRRQDGAANIESI